jgi:ParB family transcriptional regulator, chromosome partitioning protein
MAKATIEQQFKMVPLKDIHPDPNQPRKFYNERAMQELAASVKSKGVLQPILLRPAKKGFNLVCGERRFRAAKDAKLTEIPAVIRELTDEEALELQIIENLQRKDVHPMEEAVAFKSLGEKFTPEELSLRVGKSASYVAKRIKLNDLVPDVQEIFFGNHMTYSQALQLARMEPSVQKEILKDCGVPKNWKTRKEDWQIDDIDWAISKKSFDLSRAIFKTNDPDLYPEMGGCNTCPFNSANQPLLFDDNKKRICSKPSCFNIKTHRARKQKFEQVAANPDIICIADSYLNSEGEEDLKAAKDAGVNILDKKLYETYYTADPTMLYDDWKEEERYDEEDEDFSESEAKEEYEAYVKENEEDLKKQEELIKSGEIIKAYVIAGYDSGKEKMIKLKSGAEVVTAVMAGNAGDAEILSEIAKIEQREKRSKELDAEKIWVEILGLYNKEEVRHKIFVNDTFSQSEVNAIAVAMSQKISYPHREWHDDFKQTLSKHSDFCTEMGMREIARMFLHDALATGYGSHIKAGSNNNLAYKVLKSYVPFEIELIEENQKGIAEQRAERVQKRIQALKKKLEVTVE